MYIVQTLSKLPGVSRKAIPELMLPKRAVGVPRGVNAKRCNLLGVVHNFGDGQRIGKIDDGVPMIRHQDVPAKEKLQAFAGFLDDFDEQWVFVRAERFDAGSQIDVDKKEMVGKVQAANVGHPRRVSLRVIY